MLDTNEEQQDEPLEEREGMRPCKILDGLATDSINGKEDSHGNTKEQGNIPSIRNMARATYQIHRRWLGKI